MMTLYRCAPRRHSQSTLSCCYAHSCYRCAWHRCSQPLYALPMFAIITGADTHIGIVSHSDYHTVVLSSSTSAQLNELFRCAHDDA